MVMKIYGAPTGNCMRAILPLFEAEVDIDKEVKLVLVEIAKSEHKRPEYLAKNPLGVLPCLEDGDFILYESRAIARYLAEKYQHQGVPLLGKTLKERATINQWCEVEGQNLTPAAAPLFREVFLATMEKRPVNEEFINSCVTKIEAVMDFYEVQLSKNKYITGDEYTLADAFHVPYVYRLMAMKKEIFTGRKHVLAWAENLISRPAFQKLLEKNSAWSKE